jgi:signal transduction histidine kinase
LWLCGLLASSVAKSAIIHLGKARSSKLSSLLTGFSGERPCRLGCSDQSIRARGVAYAIFYSFIGHYGGAEIIVVCSCIFAVVPWLLRRTGDIGLAGHLVVGTMAAGFTQLTLIEGGIHSHAVAWFSSVPLCALLVIGTRSAVVWTGVCFVVGAVISSLTLFGWELTPLYDPRWHDLIDTAGNLGLIVFLFVLGLVFEVNRATAFQRMQSSIEELAASNEELAHLNNEKTEFLGMAAHDLRNPLTAIIGNADLLQIPASSEEVAESGTEISKAGRRMLELINDLLDANAIEEGRYASQLEPRDLRTLVETSLQNHHSASERKQIPLALEPGPPCWVQADRKAALQVIDNLVSNALKYSPPGSRITLSLREGDEWTQFNVQDQGPGISEADQKKLLQKHTRLSARPTGGESSVGLGLSIVKRLAEAMGGSVGCQSVLGKGATFYLRLVPVPEVLIPTVSASYRNVRTGAGEPVF